jgi:hypothetical protein
LQGVKAGVSDLMLALPLHGYAGLFIEMKSETGKASALQLEFLETMRLAGYAGDVVKGCSGAIQLTLDYILNHKGAQEAGLRAFLDDTGRIQRAILPIIGERQASY